MIPVAVIGIIVALIVYTVKKRQGVSSEVSFTPRFILKIYLYFMILASIITFVGGLSFLLNGFFANQFGPEFSYRPEYVTPAVEVIDANGNPKPVEATYEIPAHAGERDIIRGLTMVMFGLLIGVIHVLVTRAVETKEERMNSPLYRLYVVIGLSVFTIGSLVSIPVGIYRALSYQFIEQPSTLDPYQRLVPGESIASAIAYLPFWILFIWSLYQLQKVHKMEHPKAVIKTKTKK